MSTETVAKNPVETQIILHEVRLAFPDLFTATQFEGAGKFAYKATFLVEPGSKNYDTIVAAIQKAATAKWGEKAKDVLAKIEGESQKFCFINGNKKDYDGFKGKWALASSRSSESGAPLVIDARKRDGQFVELKSTDGRPYGGCYVNAKVKIWAQDNQWGKGVRATLETVQFARDGDAFGGAGPADSEGLEEVADDGRDLI